MVNYEWGNRTNSEEFGELRHGEVHGDDSSTPSPRPRDPTLEGTTIQPVLSYFMYAASRRSLRYIRKRVGSGAGNRKAGSLFSEGDEGRPA